MNNDTKNSSRLAISVCNTLYSVKGTIMYVIMMKRNPEGYPMMNTTAFKEAENVYLCALEHGSPYFGTFGECTKFKTFLEAKNWYEKNRIRIESIYFMHKYFNVDDLAICEVIINPMYQLHAPYNI